MNSMLAFYITWKARNEYCCFFLDKHSTYLKQTNNFKQTGFFSQKHMFLMFSAHCFPMLIDLFHFYIFSHSLIWFLQLIIGILSW